MEFTRIGRYETKELLGVGGFGSVFKAFDPRLEDTVALKILAENWSQVPDIRKRFRSEAVMLRRLQTQYEVSGFVNVFDVDETPSGQPFFVMTYADRGTLAERIGPAPLTLDDVLPFIQSISHSLSLLHQLGFVHRDIKPSNIFFRSNGETPTPCRSLLQTDERVLISDLGMAKDLNRQTMSGLSLAGGTPRYMAPEQHHIGAPVDHRVDIYAASILLGLLVTEPTEPLSEALAVGTSSNPADRPPTMEAWFESVLRTQKKPQLSSASQPLTPPPLPPGHSTPPHRQPNISNSSEPSITAATLGSDHDLQKLATKSSPASLRHLRKITAAVVAVGSLVLFSILGPDSRIVGPTTIEVGQTVTYRADVDAGTSIRWIDWNGETIEDDDLVVTPQLPGELSFSLTADGKTSDQTITVEPSDQSPTVIGPNESGLNEALTFEADLEDGAVSHFWVDPTGTQVSSDELSFTFSKPGDVTIILIAVDGDGIERGARHQVTVSNA